MTSESPNELTRDEARARAALLRVTGYDVELDLSGAGSDAETFAAVSRIRFTAAESGSTHVDITAAGLVAATLNGTPLDLSGFTGHRLPLQVPAGPGELVVHADCRYMTTGEGLHRFHDPVDGATYLYSHFEPFDAHRMYACFDQPDLKAPFTLRVRAPQEWVVVSNSPTSGPQPDGADSVWEFEPTPPLSTYVTALVAGPYHHVHAEHDGIPLGLYCRRSLAEHLDADELFTVTRQGFDFYHREFATRYPFGKYDQCFVPEFNMGAMENAGCVTFLEDYVFRSRVPWASYERRAETVLHEMAHMWFGDLVTMRWWDDLWLNESFASYVSVLAQAEATRYTGAWTTFASSEKAWAYQQDQLTTTHPIVADIPDIAAVSVNFDGITYAKGAAVLKQLVHWVGREQFFAGLRDYFARHAFGNATCEDFLAALERAAGRDLSQWAKQWLQTAGVNTVQARPEVVDGRYRDVQIVQEALPEHPTLRPHRLAVGLYDFDGERLRRRQRVELDIDDARTEVPELAGAEQAALLLVNDDDLSYAKIHLDERSLATLRESIAALDDSLARALCWSTTWEMTRDARLRARDFVTQVLTGVAGEPDHTLQNTLLRQARLAVDRYVAPAARGQVLAQFAREALRQTLAAEPGSDQQLVWARAFAGAAESAEDVAVVRELLAGERQVAGLTVDVELRWHLLVRLAAVGAVDEAAIDAERARDDTAAGHRYALMARAALPSAVAKEWAWSLATSGTLANAQLLAVVAGFRQGGQQELLAPYVGRYFAEIRAAWVAHTPEMAHRLVAGLYPILAAEPETLRRSDELIARADVPRALARLVREQRDELARAIRARELDAS